MTIATTILEKHWEVSEYHTLIREGFFSSDEQFELLERRIVPKLPRSPRHNSSADLAHEALRDRTPKGWRLRSQSAITTSDSEPEPDLALVVGPADRYVSSHPEGSDIAMVVEVAESSLAEDRRDKARIYARAGIAVYWIVNLVDSKLEVYTDPTGPNQAPAYRKRDDFGINDSAPLVINGQQIADVPVRDLLP